MNENIKINLDSTFVDLSPDDQTWIGQKAHHHDLS